jgi:hypothetical protein
MLGFDKVFDTNFSADLTIMEEGSELLKRIREGGKLPMITSCSPGWVTYLEKHHPELIDHLSTAKSPQAMFGAVAKTYYAQKMGWDPHDVVSVSVMPCTAKKYEASRPELGRDGYQDVDYVLTTRELMRREMIRWFGPYADRIQVAASGNLPYNQTQLAREGLGIYLVIRLDCAYDGLRFVPLSPPLESGTVLAWKKTEVLSATAAALLRFAEKYVGGISDHPV